MKHKIIGTMGGNFHGICHSCLRSAMICICELLYPALLDFFKIKVKFPALCVDCRELVLSPESEEHGQAQG